MNKLILIIVLLSNLYPCAVCFGNPDHPVTQGMNNAIIFLLFVIIFILLCIGSGMYILSQKSKMVELTRSIDDK